MNKKFKLGITLFIIGLLGILTMLTVTIPLDGIPKTVTESFSPLAIQLLLLTQPTLLLAVAVITGTILYSIVELTVPQISALLNFEKPKITILEQVKYGVSLGVVAGFLIFINLKIFKTSIPEELTLLNEKIKLTAIARFGYGGITEELLLRYGLMTLVVWIIFKIRRKLTASVYWTSILITAIIFAIAHFPIVYTTVTDPKPVLLIYILIGNSIPGLFFGWLYWRKGLESAFLGHIFTHIILLIGTQFFL